MSEDLDVRRPELLGALRTGTVPWFKEEKDYGRITATGATLRTLAG